MTKRYTFFQLILPFALFVVPYLLHANGEPTGNPLSGGSAPDSLASKMGHCNPITVAVPNCAAKTLELSAFVSYLFTGLLVPYVATWNTGEVAHKITVTPPGAWSWDPTATGCEEFHWNNTFNAGPFFSDTLEILSPGGICAGGTQTLTASPSDYIFSAYFWNQGPDTGPTFEISSPGVYTLTALDEFGCPFTDQVTVPLSIPVPTISGPPQICIENGSSLLQVNQQYTSYLWSTGETENPITVFEPGAYLVTITDSIGCTGEAFYLLQPNPIFNPTLSGPLYMCSLGDTAMVQTNQAWSSYVWENGETTNPLTIFEPGTYLVTVTNTLGCTGVGAVLVGSGDIPAVPIVMSSPSICVGNPDTLRAIGGFISYIWSNNVSGRTNIVTLPGIYTVTVTSVYGCTGIGSVTVGLKPTPTLSISTTPMCPGGTSTLTVSGSTFPLTQYQWSGGQTTNPITVSAAGTYSVTVSGPSFCPVTASVTVVELPPPTTLIAPPAQLNCVLQQTNLNAMGSSSGVPFTFVWTTVGGNFVSGQTTLNPLVDAVGTYTLLITNGLTGCTSSATVPVTINTQAPPAPAGSPATLNCTVLNLNIGPVPAPIDSTLLPVWVAGPGGNIVSGLNTWNPNINQPGTYILTVTNPANGCTATGSVVIPQNTALPTAAIAPPSQLTCTMNSVALNGSGSSSGPNFTYLWTTSVGGTISGSTTTASTTAGSVGTYTLLVTNTINGCTSTTLVNVTADVNIPITAAQPPATLTCAIPSVVINATGTTPGLTYTWTGPGIIGGQGTLQPTVDAPGTYTLLVFNSANSCSATLSVLVPEDVAPPAANAGLNATLNCVIPTLNLDGSASATGPDFTYLWTTGNGNIVSGNTGLSPTVSMAGTYNLLVTNTINGCTSTASVQVNNDASAPVASIANPATLTCTTLQTIINASASTQGPTYVYTWSGPGIVSGQNTAQPTVDAPGVYTLDIVNSANGCTDTETITVPQDIVPPVALAGNDGLINCTLPTGVVGSASNPGGPNFTLVWTTLGGNFTAATNGPTAAIDAAGTYTLLITNNTNGCTDTDVAIVLDDFAQPLIDAGPGFQLTCTQATTVLQGTGSTGSNFTYLWTTPMGGNILSGANTLTPTVNASGTYNLLITNTTNGCTINDQVQITQSAGVPVSLIAPPSTLTCTLTSLNLNANGSSVSPSISYAWTSTGGNITAGGTTLTPTIDAPGTYTLQTTDAANNCTSLAVIIVAENIIPPVVEAGNLNTLTCAVLNLPLAGSISSSSSTNLVYAWSTTNGTILSGANTLTPTIGAIGTYTLLVTDNINGCTGTDNVLINNDIAPPIAAIAQPQTLTCTLEQTPINGNASSQGPNFTYLWTTIDGNILTGPGSSQPTVDAPGTYNLLVTNTTNGCTQTASIVVVEDVLLPIAAAGPSVGLDCDTQTNALDGTTSSQGLNFSYAWSTTNGQIVSGGTTLTPQIGDPGTYVLTVNDLTNGCVSISSVLVTQDVALPVFAIALPQLLTCVLTSTPVNASGNGFGTSPTYTWATSNGNIVSGNNTLNATVDAPGTYTLTIVNNQNGCTDVEQVVVNENVNPPTVNTQPVPPLNCTILERTLQANAPAQALLQWTTQNGNIVSGANTANPVVDEPGLYVVTATLPLNGCSAVANVPLLQEQNVPTGLEFKLDPPLCTGVLGLLSVEQIDGGVGPFQYSIDGGATFFPPQDIDGLNPGTYDLVIQDANGCTITQVVPVPAPPTPAVALPPSFSIVLGDNQELQAVVPPAFPLPLIDQVIWTPTTGLTFEGTSIAQQLNPVALPFVTTEYKVTIITKEGCKAESRTIIRVDRDIDIYAPNVIWADDPDSNNGAFTLFTRAGSVNQILSLQIYDRWGEQLFVNRNFLPDDPSLGWPGDYKGEFVNPGVFVWWAEVELIDGQKLLLKGDVTVVR